MISKSELEEIRTHLEASQNPLFFFDNDVDGLCSFLILQRAIGRGKGIAIKSFPDLHSQYLSKVDELNPDFVFILDKPLVSKEFITGLIEKNIKVIWIDHHEVQVEKEVLEMTHYYNSFPSSEPVTYIAYQAVHRKEDMFLAMIGCIGDVYMPNFAKEFTEKYPELFNADLNVFDSMFLTEIGKAVQLLNFALKDTTTNVVSMIKYLAQIKDVYDILQENKHSKTIHLRANQLKKIYTHLIEKAENNLEKDKKLLFFTYSGEMSMSAELANGLYFKHRDKMIAVCFRKQDSVNISIRGKNAKKFVIKIVDSIEGATGGGHEDACGARIPESKLADFRKKMEELLG